MAAELGRGRKMMRILTEINEETDRVSWVKPAEQQVESKLPPELLEMIISQLTLRDNICASIVCKRWLNAAISSRNVDKPPLLMIFPKTGELYEFYDPSERKSYWLELPELRDCKVIYTKDGWLLLQKLNTQVIFFFSPYTRDMIKLPFKNLRCGSVAFSAAPTSGNCILTAVLVVGQRDVSVSTFRLGGSIEWTIITYTISFPFLCDYRNKLVFRNGLFYCFSFSGLFCIYNPDTVTWAVHPIRHAGQSSDTPTVTSTTLTLSSFRSFFLAEHDGDTFGIFTKSGHNPKIYKFDPTEKVWSEWQTLGRITLFINKLSSVGRANLGRMRDRVYLSKVSYKKQCVSYSLDEGRYYPKRNCFDWHDTALHTSIWMEQPENISIFH